MISSGRTEAVVTLDVGPRIIRFGFAGSRNELFENPRDMGRTGGSEYRSYGGHRLWIAPEHSVRTMQPENEPVEAWQEGAWSGFRTRPDQFGIQKELLVCPRTPDGLEIRHVVRNLGMEPTELAPWALTVMAAGGECVFPQPPHQPHSVNFLPVRPLVLWSYTDMTDRRWSWGARLVRLRQRPEGGPQKVGSLVRQGWAAYSNEGTLFIKRFSCLDGSYPDMGCNFETFTRQDMLEVESLGPQVRLLPGEQTEHREAWYLLETQELPGDEHECAELLEGVVASRPL